MRKNRDRIFRFPFDIDTRVFLALTLVFFIFSIQSVQDFLSGTNHLTNVQTRVEKEIEKKLKDAEQSLSSEAVTQLCNKNFLSPAASDLFKKPYYIYVYQNHQLVFWNHNQILPNLNVSKAVCGRSSSNESYVQIKLDQKIKTGTDVYVLIPVKKINPKTGKPYLVAFQTENNYGYDLTESPTKEALPIQVEKETAFYIIRNDSSYEIFDPYGWKLFVCALPFIFMGISIHTYFKVVLQYRNKLMVWVTLILFAIVIRGLTFQFGFPNDFSSFRPFNPSLFYHDFLNRSLGDTFINVCLLFWILLFYIMNIQGLPNVEKWFSKYKILTFFNSACLILLCVFQVRLMEKMVLHSEIVFDSTRFTSINNLTFIGILTFMVAMANVLLCIYIIYNRFSLVRSKKWPKYALCLALYAILFLFGRNYFSLATIHFSFILTLILLILMEEKRMRIKFDFNSYELILWIICFSLLITSFFIYSIEKREKSDREAYAHSMLKQMDREQSAEFVFDIRQRTTQKLQAQPYSDFNTFKNELYSGEFKSLLSEYQITITLPNDSLPKQFTRVFHGNEWIFNRTHHDSILAFQNAQEMSFIFSLHPFADTSKVCEVYLKKILLPMKNSKQEIDFSTEDSRYADYEYGIGLYTDSFLTGNNGYQLLPSVIQPSVLFSQQNSFLRDTVSTSELWVHESQGKTIVIAKSKNIFSRFLTLFAILFFIYFIVITSYILGNIIARSNLGKKRFMNLLNLNLRLRIHGSILITMLFAFIAVGYFTSYYLISQYDRSTNEKAMERMAHIKSDLYPAYRNETNQQKTIDTLYQECHRLSNELGIPISLYDYNKGKLLFTTSSLLNDIRFPVDPIAPEAMFHLGRNQSDYYAIHEQQQSKDYYNTFSVLRSPANHSTFILQMPFHQSGIYFRKETFSVIVTLINTFVIVFLISAFISLLLTNSVVEPFKFIMKRFTKINLAGTNEPLPWKYSDEMGVLVREYNRMLRTLENRTQLLARSEREMAWREMAKQVAHEIKNPMTPMKLSLQLLEKAIKEKKGNIVEMAERMIKTMIEQIDTLTVIATNFSTFARMPENKNEVMLLNEVLTAVTGMYTNDQQIEYDFAIPQYPVYIFADKTQLIRVFTNIIQNAIQSLPETNKGMISMTVQKVKNNYIRVSISDNGIGIPKEKGEKLFQPYFTTKSSGTGLGLAMCKDIIEQLNGTISYESTEGEGTTFFVDLPIYDMDLPIN